MTHLIDKDALVAWLKERIRDYWCDSYALKEVIKYVDTLEVKEVQEEPYTMSDTGSYTTTTK